MQTELFIENFQIDISQDISSLLTFAIDDIKDFGSRQTTFSKTIVLPGTSRNNKLFGSIYKVGVSNDYNPGLPNIGINFNASVAAKCILFQDSLQTFKGTMRLLEIISENGRIEYEAALNGELTSLSVSLSGSLLEDLDFSEHNHVFNVGNIVDSWDNPGGSGYYYPLIDYGNYSTLKHDWNVFTFRPAFYAKEYIDKMFAAANFRYDCDLFDTARFKSLIIPYNQKILYNKQTVALNVFRLSDLTITTSAYIPLSTVSVLGGFTPSGGNTLFTYSGAPINGSLDLALNILDSDASSPTFYVDILVNGVSVSSALVLVGIFPYRLVLPTASVSISSGDVISVYITNPFPGSRTMTYNTAELKLSSVNNQPVQANYNDNLKVNGSIPANIRQVDFLTSIVKLFNLYIYESPTDDRLMIIKPYVDFYSTDSGNAVDWTYKLNRNEQTRVKPLSELTSKNYIFSYKDDSDYYNDLYKKRYNQGYGSYIFTGNFEFAEQETKLELIFAATPIVGYNSEDKVYSTILKKNGTTEEQVDSAIRILQTKKITGVSSWDIKNGVTVLDSNTSYGYAGHFNDPDNPTNDLNFGALKELFFALATGSLNVTQFNVYWSSYMAEITDKDSKMLIGRFYLTPVDIANLDFSKYVHVDGSIFRLNKISDYNASTPADCEVMLLSVQNTLY